jgi:hypothetical protein
MGNILGEHFFITYLLTPCSGVLLEKLTGLQLVKIFHAFYGTRRFLTALTSARHVSLSWASPVHSPHRHLTSWRSILTLSSHLRLCLPSGLFPPSFPTRTLYTPLPYPIRATCPAHLLLDFITRTILGKEYRTFSSSLCNFRTSLLLNLILKQSQHCVKLSTIRRDAQDINMGPSQFLIIIHGTKKRPAVNVEALSRTIIAVEKQLLLHILSVYI